MPIEPIYTLEELAEMTGRPTSFWASECDSGRLGCIRPDPDQDSVLVLASDFTSWVEAFRSGDGRPEGASADGDEVPAAAFLTKAEQEALLPVP
jgi:hypothetical protein